MESYCLKAVRLINQTEPSYVAQGILVAEIKKFLDCLNIWRHSTDRVSVIIMLLLTKLLVSLSIEMDFSFG